MTEPTNRLVASHLAIRFAAVALSLAACSNNVPQATASIAPSSGATKPDISPLVSPSTLSPKPSRTDTEQAPSQTFPPLATLPATPQADVRIGRSALRRWFTFGSPRLQLIVEIDNVGEAPAEVYPDQTRWTTFDESGVILRSGTFEVSRLQNAIPIKAGGRTWLWTDVRGGRPARWDVSPGWDTVADAAYPPIVIAATTSFTRSLRVRARMTATNTGDEPVSVRVDIVVLDTGGIPLGAGQRFSPFVLDAGQRIPTVVLTSGPVPPRKVGSYEILVDYADY